MFVFHGRVRISRRLTNTSHEHGLRPKFLEEPFLLQLVHQRVIDEFLRLAVFEIRILLGVEIDRVAHAVQIYARREGKTRREILIGRSDRLRIVDTHAVGENLHRSVAVRLDDVNRFGVAAQETLHPVAILSERAAFYVQGRLCEVGAHVPHVRQNAIARFGHNG